jgi:hypothetical protein
LEGRAYVKLAARQSSVFSYGERVVTVKRHTRLKHQPNPPLFKEIARDFSPTSMGEILK